MNKNHGSLGTVAIFVLCSFFAFGAQVGGQQAAAPPRVTSAVPASDYFAIVVGGVVAVLVSLIPSLFAYRTAQLASRKASTAESTAATMENKFDDLMLALVKKNEVIDLIHTKGKFLTQADLQKDGQLQHAFAELEKTLLLQITIVEERLKPRAVTTNDVTALLATLKALGAQPLSRE